MLLTEMPYLSHSFSDDFLISLLGSHQTQLLQPRHLSEQLFDASLLETDVFADFASREKTMRFKDKLHATRLSQTMLLGTMLPEPPPPPVSTSPERLLVEAHREKEIEILHVFPIPQNHYAVASTRRFDAWGMQS